MADAATDTMAEECRLARRLGRLFRIEREGRLDRRPGEIARRIVERRGVLVERLMRLEASRRSLIPWVPLELTLAMEVLEREVARSLEPAARRVEALAAELRLRRGVGTMTGLRDRADGTLLGRG